MVEFYKIDGKKYYIESNEISYGTKVYELRGETYEYIGTWLLDHDEEFQNMEEQLLDYLSRPSEIEICGDEEDIDTDWD